MLKSVLLHIGSPKCGSTYLQNVFLQNRDRLMAAGIAYPHEGGAHPGNAAGLRNITEKTLKKTTRGAHTLVLSHEDLFSGPAVGEELAGLARSRGLEVNILVFLRPFSGFVFGDYSQFMKQHFESYARTRRPYDGRSFEEFAVYRSRVLAVAGWLKGWSARFPGGTITLSSPQSIRQVTEPLLAGVELDWEVPRQKSNPSLRMEDCDRLAAALRDPAIPYDTLKKMLQKALKRTGMPDEGRTPERVAWIEAIFGKQNDDLREAFGFDNRLLEEKVVPEPVTLRL